VLDDLAEWDGRPVGWKDTRWTGVIEKRDGAWVIPQTHFSFAADKVAAETRARLQQGTAEARRVLSGDYLGQKPPGAEPEIFAPGIISTGLSERDIAITPDGNEIYFGRYVGQYRYAVIMVVRRVDGVWGEPEIAPFSGIPGVSDLEPALAYDGSRLYFLSDRPAKPGAASGQDIWYVERSGSSWGPATPLGPPICTSADEYFPSLTRDGTMYFTLQGDPSRPDGIYRSRFREGAFTTPERLPDHVNSGRARYNAFIAPDESYLLYAILGRADGFGRSDYYVAFRAPDDTWSEPINLGPAFNSKADEEYSAQVTRDGRILFFMSTRTPSPSEVFGERVTTDVLQRLATSPGNGNADIWWVDAGFLQSLRSQAKVDTEAR
jgi:hypothetical protein